ncbi:MAG: hypothetical protein JW913_12280 [Chitinispirillaceae bacterium]|nr:hypothetical protein [Chitinispirillaceae bacterium]
MRNWILFLFILIQSIFSEDIVGFNFGGYFTNHEKYDELSKSELIPHEFQIDSVNFFDNVQIGTDTNYSIKYLLFTKSYTVDMFTVSVQKVNIANDYRNLLSSLSSRYGTFDTSNALNILGLPGKLNGFYLNEINEVSFCKKPNSININTISLILTTDNQFNVLENETSVNIVLWYMDKELSTKFKNISKKKYSGF